MFSTSFTPIVITTIVGNAYKYYDCYSRYGDCMTTIQVSEERHIELRKIKGSLLATNGKERSFDETIGELVDFWKGWHDIIKDYSGVIDTIKQKKGLPNLPKTLEHILIEFSGMYKEEGS